MAVQTTSFFAQWVPFDVIEKAGSPLLGVIEGIASSEAEDADGEIVEQDGIDWSWFVGEGTQKGRGHITYEHPLGIANLVGHPISVEPIVLPNGTKATKIKAALLLDDPVGKAIYDKAMTMKKAGGHRQLGFSIEGKVPPGGRKAMRITKAMVLSVAISPAPKNPDSWFEPLAASMLATLRQDGVQEFLYRAEGIGYPTQGADASGKGGLDKLTPQSHQDVKGKKRKRRRDYEAALKGMSSDDLIVARILKRFPYMSWSQGVAAVETIHAEIKSSK